MDEDEEDSESFIPEGWASFKSLSSRYLESICCESQCKQMERRAEHLRNTELLLSASPQMMTLIVENKRITCHTAILSYYSEYFDAAANGGFIESKKGEISLVTESALCVEIFVSWLYTGTIIGTLMKERMIENLLAKLWLLGDRFRCPKFQNEIMSLLFSVHVDLHIDSSTVGLAYENTINGSKFRRYVLDLAASHDSFDFDTRYFSEIDDASLPDYHREWINLFEGGGEFVRDYCLYLTTRRNRTEVSSQPSEWGKEEQKACMVDDPKRPVKRFIKAFLAGKTRGRLQI